MVGIGVSADIDARHINVIDNFGHASPILFSGRFQMPDFDRHVRFAANADGFVQRGNDRVALTTHVRGINAAELAGFGG
jgi:hypothetical protein